MLDACTGANSGLVFNIQRYNVHDGSGIRTIVFLKGCTLRCKWCANPEGISPMTQLRFVAEKCVHCGACAAQCRSGACRIMNGEIVMDWQSCMHCGACADVCPAGAREMMGKTMSVEEVMREVRRDFQFYRHSGGGVTLSGGEALLQRDFVREILKMAHEEGMNTAVETCGHIPWENLEEVLPYVDLFLFDLKQMDSEKHFRLTGQRNELILNNAIRLVERNAEVFFRVPIIPGCNDSEDNICAIARFAAKIDVERVELLPYHKYGVGKYAQLGLKYEMLKTQEPDAEYMQHLQRIVEETLSDLKR